MSWRHNNRTVSLKSALLLILLLTCASAGNYFSLRIFSGFHYLFGSVAVLMATRIYGLGWGILASLIASAWTIRLLGHPYAMVWSCGETLFIGWLLRRGRPQNLILYDAVYWPLAGAPLLWFTYRFILNAPQLESVTTTLIYWVVGITNALIASLLLTGYTSHEQLHNRRLTPRSIPVQHLMFNLLMAIVAVPAVIIMIQHGRNIEKANLREMLDAVNGSALKASYEIRLFLAREGQAIPEPPDLARVLTLSRDNQFQTITLLDSGRRVIASTNGTITRGARYPLGTQLPGEQDVTLAGPADPLSVPPWQRAAFSRLIKTSAIIDSPSWQILIETPLDIHNGAQSAEQIKSLLTLLALYMLALVSSISTAQRLTAPLRQLSQVTTDLPERLLHENISSWPESTIAEIDQLIANFRSMSNALSLRFQEITSINAGLEKRVQERTADLSKANEDLQREIAERRLTERQRDHLMDELVNHVRFLQTLIDTIPNPIFYMDGNGLYQGCNRAFEDQWGLSREEIVGKTVYDIFPRQSAEQYDRDNRALIEQGGIRVNETRMDGTDGTIHTVIICRATYLDITQHVAGLVGTIVDITDRKKAETERDHLMLELQQKNKELEGIVYVVSHDLRSPLINVQGFSKKLGRYCDEITRMLEGSYSDSAWETRLKPILDNHIPRSLGYITSSIERMDSLLSGLLRLSRLGRAAISCDRIDMQKLVGEVITSMTYQIESVGARVHVDTLLPCHADHVQLMQVFSNLLDNALKYRAKDRSPEIRISCEQFPEGIRYCVEDNGVGIPREQQGKIWELFHRLNPGETTGEGLGLTMARRIIDRLGGSIWIESEEDKGSRFYVVLPVPPEIISV